MSNQFKFTTKSIESLATHSAHSKSTEKEYSDTEVTGLRLLVGKSGAKKFLLRYVFHGRKRSIAIGPFPALTVMQARQQALELKSQVARDIDPKAVKEAFRARITLKEYISQFYLPHAQSNKRSANSDESKLVHYILPEWGNWPMAEITNYDIQGYLNRLGQGLKPATVNRHHSLLHRIFVLAIQWGHMESNPASNIRKRNENNRMERFLNHNEIRHLFEAADKDENVYAGAFIKYLLLTGSRKSEALNAQHKHITQRRNRWVWHIPETKSGKDRYVPLTNMAVELIQKLEKKVNNPFIFCGKIKGQPINNPMKAFKRILKQAGIESSFRLHDLRHTSASLIINNGGTLYDVQAALGHSSSRMSERYSHLSDQRLVATSNMVSDCVQAAISDNVQL